VRVHHLAFRTSDVLRLGKFYEETLRLRVIKRSAGRIWLEIGPAVLMLEARDPGEPALAAGTGELVAFAIGEDERQVWEERLAASGVVVEARTAHTLYFRDPDGRRIGVSSYAF
jgi:catechol 2,3-dioxygenase-like lactoylglutathione lyase family enzyme